MSTWSVQQTENNSNSQKLPPPSACRCSACTSIFLVTATVAEIAAVISVILRTMDFFTARVIAISSTSGCGLLRRGEILIPGLRPFVQCIDPGGIAIAHSHACTCKRHTGGTDFW